MKSPFLTRVLLHYGGSSFNHYLRFGNPVFREDVTGRAAWEYFSAGQIFCYVRWETNAYGTRYWRLSVLQAAIRNKPVFRLPGITPGAIILLDVKGVDRVKKAYAVIGEIEELNIDPADVPANYFLHIHQRLNTGLVPRTYTHQQHRAFMKAKIFTEKRPHQCDE